MRVSVKGPKRFSLPKIKGNYELKSLTILSKKMSLKRIQDHLLLWVAFSCKKMIMRWVIEFKILFN